jgi:hypothetical protein
MKEMVRWEHGLSPTELKLKVVEITQQRETPFTNGIPGTSWLKLFKRRHPEFTLRMFEGLEVGRARGLCPMNVASFYQNLEKLYNEHKYDPHQIWNVDESGAQAGRNGPGRVLVQKGTRSVHSIIPDSKEWVTVLSSIIVVGETIPNFYIFKGMRRKRDYIAKCEANATMAMQNHAWMDAFLFNKWMDHFIEEERRYVTNPKTSYDPRWTQFTCNLRCDTQSQ